MTRRLARLADISYRRRGRMVLAWIVATVVLIALGSSFAGEYEADYASSAATRGRKSTSSGRTRAGLTARPRNAASRPS